MPLYKKKIGYVAGTEVRKAEAQVYGDNKKISDDAKNRKYVGEKINQRGHVRRKNYRRSS